LDTSSSVRRRLVPDLPNVLTGFVVRTAYRQDGNRSTLWLEAGGAPGPPYLFHSAASDDRPLARSLGLVCHATARRFFLFVTPNWASVRRHLSRLGGLFRPAAKSAAFLFFFYSRRRVWSGRSHQTKPRARLCCRPRRTRGTTSAPPPHEGRRRRRRRQ
jgi:hypothetical protein